MKIGTKIRQAGRCQCVDDPVAYHGAVGKAYGCRHYAVLRGQPLELLVQRHAVPARKDAVSPAADPAPDPYPERHGRYDRRRRLPDKRNDTVRDCCGCYTAHPLYLSVRSEVLCKRFDDRCCKRLIDIFTNYVLQKSLRKVPQRFFVS